MKRKALSLTLSFAILLSGAVNTFAANQDNSTSEKTYIETSIGFMYPEDTVILQKKNIKAILTGNNKNIEIPLSEMLSNNKDYISQDGLDITFEKFEEDGKIKSIKFKINGLDAADGYELNLQGKNYVTTTINLSTSEFSKRVNISTQNTMVLGDVNADNIVNESDIKLLEENLNTSNQDYDINGDGLVTVSDISIVNNNMVKLSNPVVFDTDMFAPKVFSKLDQQALQDSVKIEEGAIENIFKEDKVVKLAPKENETNVSIDLDFGEKPQEMSSVSITLPDGTPEENVVIKVVDENGQIVDAPKTSSSNLLRSASLNFISTASTTETTVTVNLGKRVPVKKVIIEVTPKEEGGFVVLDKVSFLKDVVDETVVESLKVTNIDVEEGSEEVTLSWREISNVGGYKVYYGESKDNLNKVLSTDTNSITITELKNLNTYYFQISPISGNWEGEKSDIISATPQPASIPFRPDFVKATAEDNSINVSWKKADNAKTYNVYMKKEGEDSFRKVVDNTSETKATINNLEYNKEYTIYVTSVNSIGESQPSEYAQATPKKEEIIAPILPIRNKISNSNIQSVEISHKDHYDKNLYPDGFNTQWLYDENYETSWVARAWWEANSFKFTFNEAKDMDYLVWVPRLDGKYRQSHDRYHITVWTENDDLSKPGTMIAKDRPIRTRGKDNSYYILDFPKQEKVKKIEIKIIQWNGSPTNTNASEVVFYEYNDISDRIAALFANDSRTQIANGVKIEQIDKLIEEVSAIDGFVVNREILLKELELAKALLNNDNSKLGVIKDNVYSVNVQKDQSTYQAINNYQPLGIVGRANEEIVVFADIPEGETVEIIPTQYFEQASFFTASPIKLVSGRNIITIPKIGSVNYDRGGSLYVTYSGNNADKIKLQVLGGQKIPYLELKDLHKLDESKAKAKIKEFILELEQYVPTLKGNLQHQILNSCEISLPDVLLSLPANKILEGIKRDAPTIEAQVDNVYNSALAWEDLFKVVYNVYGIDDHINAGLETRHNIRYMKMFADAFMYAAGNHIGIGYGSVAGLMTAKPASMLPEGATSNNIFGWGIAHEVGHVLDKLGKAEITNNIYSLMVQTFDGKNNTLPSRIETNDAYPKVFTHVSSGSEGLPNDGLLNLAMYWQLHLAYDDADKPFDFYNKLYKAYRAGTGLENFTEMNKFAVAASKAANKDLTEFFTRWGVKLSDEAKNVMKTLPKENRAIYYLSDESRRQRIAKNNGNTNINVTAISEINPENPKEVKITINGADSNQNVQGYEIIRNNKTIGFTTTSTFIDSVNSYNNTAFEYKVLPIDILGNKGQEVSAGSVRISYDKTVDRSLFNVSNNEVTFTKPTVITGIKLTPKTPSNNLPTSGNYSVSIKVGGNSADEYTLAKAGDFSVNASKDSNSYVAYFNKPGDTADKMWSYDALSVKLTGIDTNAYNVDFISYPGDDIEFLDMGIGRLAKDYVYGSEPDEVIEAGTLVIVGNYRGNTTTNKIYVKGKFVTSSPLADSQQIEERPINGYTLMFDEIPDSGKITSSTTQGLFIFVPDIQKEAEIKGEAHEHISVLPTEIKAEMHKEANGGSFVTTDTLWVNMPSDDTLPQIEIK